MSKVKCQDLTPILKSSKSLFVLTGAGISAESGIPTFRGKDGLWKNYSATDLATPEAFERDPAFVWEWYMWRREIISRAKPNPAHYALVEMEKKFPKFLLLTQNVDDLHRRAGSKNILELHGNIFRTRCHKCGRADPRTSSPCEGEDRACPESSRRGEGGKSFTLPKCPCGGLLRPDVVWFGEMIPQDVWQSALEFLSAADCALICGTSNVVWPAAAIPEMAQSRGIKTIEINLEPTPVSSLVDVSLQGKAGEILPEIVRCLQV
jgi:NAD-dependent deacetylase